jgi:hypothetical protein
VLKPVGCRENLRISFLYRKFTVTRLFKIGRLLSLFCFAWLATNGDSMAAQGVVLRSVAGVQTLFAPPGYSLSAFQMYTTTETMADLMVFAGVSDDVEVIQVSRDGTLVANRYFAAFGWADPKMPLVPGAGIFIHNPGTNTLQLGNVGAASVGYLTNVLPAGLSLCALMLPHYGLLSTDLNFPASPNDQVILYDDSQAVYRTFTFTEAGWQPEEPLIAIGKGFWVYKSAPAKWGFQLLGGDPIFERNYEISNTNIAVANGLIATNQIFSLPVLTNVPRQLILPVGGTLRLEAPTNDNSITNLQWFLNGTNVSTDGIGGLVINSLSTNHSGKYVLAARNAAGMTLSTIAGVTVADPAPVSPFLVMGPSAAPVLYAFNLVAGYRYRIQFSTNFIDWTEMPNSSLSPNSTTSVAITNTSISGQLFYRVISP